MALEKADLVLHEGLVLGHRDSNSVALANGRIIAHGSYGELKALVGPRTHLIRLGGRTVAPGLIDSHLHYLEAAAALTGLGLWRCRSVSDLLGELRVAAGKTPPGNWLRAFGCDEALLRERRGPTRDELDRAVAKNPLRMRHQTLHASWLNSRAIKALGLEQPGFTAPPGALLEPGRDGRLSGLVVGMEEWLTRRLPLVTAAELEARARVMSRELAAAGVTAFTDATARNGQEEINYLGRFRASGIICQRVAAMIGAHNLADAARIREAGRAAGLSIAGVKFLPSSATTAGDLHRGVAAAAAEGLGCAFHATEVAELDVALSAIESAPPPRGITLAPIFRIEHGGVIPPGDIERIAALGLWVVTNPGFLYYRGVKYAAEPGLIPHLYRARSLIARGIRLAGGTDAPVTPARPLHAIAAAVARTTLDGETLAGEERLQVGEALELFTAAGARLAGLDAGEISAGKLADLIVLPRNPLELGAPELMNLPVDLTIIGGRVVYERGRPAIAQSVTADLVSG